MVFRQVCVTVNKINIPPLSSSSSSFSSPSVSDALLLFSGESSDSVGVGFDFLHLAIQGGQLVVKFNNLGGLEDFTQTGISSGRVDDSTRHQVQILFRNRILEMLVDNAERLRLHGECSLSHFTGFEPSLLPSYVYTSFFPSIIIAHYSPVLDVLL